jgi:hypothetical protein
VRLEGSGRRPATEDPVDDEPSLGWTIAGSQRGNCGGTGDLEAEPEQAEPDLCDEPSLGALERPDQTRWGKVAAPIVKSMIPKKELRTTTA